MCKERYKEDPFTIYEEMVQVFHSMMKVNFTYDREQVPKEVSKEVSKEVPKHRRESRGQQVSMGRGETQMILGSNESPPPSPGPSSLPPPRTIQTRREKRVRYE